MVLSNYELEPMLSALQGEQPNQMVTTFHIKSTSFYTANVRMHAEKLRSIDSGQDRQAKTEKSYLT